MNNYLKKKAFKKCDMHFDFSVHGSDHELFLCVGFNQYPLCKHDAGTLRELKSNSVFYQFIPDENITHYVKDMLVATDMVAVLKVIRMIELDGQQVQFPMSLHAHIPETSYQAMLDSTDASERYLSGAIHPKLKRFNIDNEQVIKKIATSNGAVNFYLDAVSYNDVFETAEALLLHHPDLLNLNGQSIYPAWIKEHLLDRNPYINELVLTLINLGDKWCTKVIAKDVHGKPIINPDKPGEFIYTRIIDQEVLDSVPGPLTWAINKAKDSLELQGEVWTVQHGKTMDDYDSKFVPPDKLHEMSNRSTVSQGVKWSVKNHTPSWGLTVDKPEYQPETKSIQITGYNRWPRHLGSYIEYLNPSSERMKLTDEQWDEVIGDIFRKILPKEIFDLIEPRPETKFKDYISPITTVCGIPLGSLLPDPTKYDLPVFDDMYGVRVIWAGMGLNSDDQDDSVCTLVGSFLTAIVDLFVPVVMYAVGASGVSNKILKAITKDKEVFKAVITIGSIVITGKILLDLKNGRNIVNILAPLVGAILPSLLITKLGPYILEKIGEGTIGKFLEAVLPEAETAMQIFNTVTTIATIMETVAACVSGPAVHKTDFVRSIDLAITVNPDEKYHKFPDIATSYQIQVVYNTDATVPVSKQKYDMTGPTRSEPFGITFEDVPAAGKLKVLIFFYADNGWQAGQGETGWVDARGDESALLKLTIKTHINIVPLTIDSVYKHKQKTVYKTDLLQWEATPVPPSATYQTISPDPQRSINALNGNITMAQYSAMVGYSWQAKGLPDKQTKAPIGEYQYTVQNISSLQDPSVSLWYPDEGTRLQSGICYELAGPETKDANNFYIDSSNGIYDKDQNPAGGFHLRKIILKNKQKPVVDTSKSWGRFNNVVERFVIHPQGYAFGINYTYCKLEILKLASSPLDDKDAQFASINAGKGFREGLINGPSSIAIALDGRVLILESINNRVQAFDLYGNPVKCFQNANDSKECWFPLLDRTGTVHYLDISVESKGYIYILSYVNDGSQPEDYHLDIYKPDGGFLVRTENIPASKIAVSILRNVFTLNYEVIFCKDKRPEPSVSMWIPPAPKE